MKEFAEDLRGGATKGSPIYIIYSITTGFIAVVVKAQGEANAMAIRDEIRAFAPKSSDGKTGAAALAVRRPNMWTVLPECRASEIML